jgi:hypothetical protein
MHKPDVQIGNSGSDHDHCEFCGVKFQARNIVRTTDTPQRTGPVGLGLWSVLQLTSARVSGGGLVNETRDRYK